MKCNLKVVRLAADGCRDGPSRQGCAVFVLGDLSVHIRSTGWEEIEIWTAAKGALPMSRFNGKDAIESRLDVLEGSV